MTETSKTIVELINGIIRHGNHSHNEYSFQEFSDMRLLNALEQTETIEDFDVELIELYDDIESKAATDDFYIEFDGNEYRIITNHAIWGIYVKSIKETVPECYELNLDKIPTFAAVSIDWEQTAENAFADGYGHTFAVYDGEDSEAGGCWIFRTN